MESIVINEMESTKCMKKRHIGFILWITISVLFCIIYLKFGPKYWANLRNQHLGTLMYSTKDSICHWPGNIGLINYILGIAYAPTIYILFRKNEDDLKVLLYSLIIGGPLGLFVLLSLLYHFELNIL